MVFSKCLMMVIAAGLRFPPVFIIFIPISTLIEQEELKFFHLRIDKERVLLLSLLKLLLKAHKTIASICGEDNRSRVKLPR